MCFLRDDLAEEVLGDLDEKFYVQLKASSLVRAKLNYWYQVQLKKLIHYPLTASICLETISPSDGEVSSSSGCIYL
jgi:hypothetical protein